MQHVGRSSSTLSNLGDAYSNALEVELKSLPRTAVYIGQVSLVNIQFSNLSSAPKPTKATLCISEDSSGDEFILTSTESIIQYGISDATKGTAIWRIDGVIALDLNLNDEVYCWIKTDHGTLDINQIVITWIGDR